MTPQEAETARDALAATGIPFEPLDAVLVTESNHEWAIMEDTRLGAGLRETGQPATSNQQPATSNQQPATRGLRNLPERKKTGLRRPWSPHEARRRPNRTEKEEP